jgi:hypothetical protein
MSRRRNSVTVSSFVARTKPDRQRTTMLEKMDTGSRWYSMSDAANVVELSTSDRRSLIWSDDVKAALVALALS